MRGRQCVSARKDESEYMTYISRASGSASVTVALRDVSTHKRDIPDERTLDVVLERGPRNEDLGGGRKGSQSFIQLTFRVLQSVCLETV